MTSTKQAAAARIAVINTHPIQYFAPLYAYLNRADDIEVTALYMSDFSLRGALDRDFGREVTWDVDLLGGYPSRFVGRNFRTIEPYGFASTIAPELLHEISRDRYDAVWIHGHGYASCLTALAAARLKGIPAFMRGETHLGLTSTGLKRSLRRPLMSALYAQCSGVLAIGSANRDYYRAMGVPDAKISVVPYAVDNNRFVAASTVSAEERIATRVRLGVTDDAPIILYASKFQRRKRPDDLLTAFLAMRAKNPRAHLALVGAGEMEAELRAAAGGSPNVHFPGFFNQADLPKVFAASDIFVLPSDEEPWGLIVNEAMCAGRPIVVSQAVGCARDLVQPGVNGEIFRARDVVGLASALDSLTRDAAMRTRMGAESRRIIDRWSYRECLTGLREALRKAGVPRNASSSLSRGASMRTS